jgi:acyl-CoA reductase-like NAD-dependent aldehyde dehydrogenase
MNLNNLKLVQDKAFVNGEWINALLIKLLQSHNPYNGRVIANVADCGKDETKNAIDKLQLLL